MVEDVWIQSDGMTGQLQETKLSIAHFDKNAYSRMNVSLAMQVLSASVARMIRSAINDDEIFLALRNKNMYTHLADLCENWNFVVDICNSRDGAHSPENARDRQMVLLDVLSWFTKWEKIHLAAVQKGEATEFNFFCAGDLVLHSFVDLGSCLRHSDLLRRGWAEHQSPQHEHRCRRVVFWRRPPNGWRKHEQNDGTTVESRWIQGCCI